MHMDRRAKALTISARRLAGSPACLNCGTALMGPFCHYCGQPDKNLMRFFPALVRDLLEDMVELDSRFMRTLKPLLFHPGKLTRDYLDGRRFRYVPPMRLYIFSSAVFFILASMLAGQALDISAEKPGGGIHFNMDSDKEGEAPSATVATDHDSIIIFDKPWNRETNPFNIPFMPDFINVWINDEIEESPQKGREIKANPNLIVEKVFDILPVAVFLMLPLVALLFKFWYLFAGKYYVEHLIHALHNHAFLFVIFTLTLLSDSLATWLDPAQTGRASEISSRLTIVLLCWIPIYLLLSLKTVYRQRWIMTLAKFSVIGVSYVVLLAIIASVAAVLGFVLL